MGLELDLSYQTNYGSTIDTLNLRDNVNKILQRTTFKQAIAQDVYYPSSKVDTVKIDTSLKEDLTNTVHFLESESALKLLNLTKRTSNDCEIDAEIIDLKIDENKINIFAA